MSKKSKQQRHAAISEILSNNAIDSQDYLLKMLLEKGFSLTQATLSRDFREMMIAKTPDERGLYFYRLPTSELARPTAQKFGITTSFYRQGVINLEFSGQMAIIKTPAGYAMGIAQDIDSNFIPGIIATIAGNDTVLCILRENANKLDIINSLKILFSTK